MQVLQRPISVQLCGSLWIVRKSWREPSAAFMASLHRSLASFRRRPLRRYNLSYVLAILFSYSPCLSFSSFSLLSPLLPCYLKLPLRLRPPKPAAFRLHKFEQPIGEETYTITHDGDTLTLKSDFEFTDRGSKVPLAATLRATADYTPQSFVIKGSTSRMSTIDTDVEINGAKATIRQGKDTRTVAAPQNFFTIAGYAPVAMQMALIRYWRAHGSPAQLATLPTGEVQIQDRGAETIALDGRSLQVERYSIRGLIWGLETLWMDSNNNLAALVSTDAEFDHFEAVREEYEPALAKFVASAARDEMAALTELSKQMPGRRTGTFAFTGATLIDGTGAAPIANATVVTRDGKILAAGPSDKVKFRLMRSASMSRASTSFPACGTCTRTTSRWNGGRSTSPPALPQCGMSATSSTSSPRCAMRSTAAPRWDRTCCWRALLTATGPHAIGIDRVNSPADAEMWVKRYHDAGFQQIKIYSSMKSDNVRAVCADAHQLGMTVTGHIPNGMTAYDGVNDGMDQINHIHYVLDMLIPANVDPMKLKRPDRLKMMASLDVNSEAGKKAIAFLKQHNTVIDPTMALMEFENRPARCARRQDGAWHRSCCA